MTGLLPVDTLDEPYFYTFKVQCTSCREIHPNWISVNRYVCIYVPLYSIVKAEDIKEQNEVSGSKGEASFVWRCKSCKVSGHL